MQTSELMIGDWVLYKGEPYQIRQLGVYGENRDGEDYPAVCIGKPIGIGLIIERNKIEPLPLTPEILKKLEFKQISTNKYVSGKVTIAIFAKEFLITIKSENARIMITIKYIHELQHTLRLCGIVKKVKL